MYRRLGDEHGVAQALLDLGHVAQHQEDREQATAHYEESLMMYRKIGDLEGTASAVNGMAVLARNRGDLEGRAHLARRAWVSIESLVTAAAWRSV